MRASATRRLRARACAASATTRRCCRGIAASRRSNGRSWKAIRSRAAPSITWPTAGTRARSPRRTGASSAKGETARELWERALAPMGLELLTRVVRHAAEHGELPAQPQDERFATKAPMIRRTISLTEEGKAVGTSLIVTAIGTDRPGIVSLLSDRAQGFGANWAGSRMANLAGQFAGMVHFEVPAQNAEPLAQALRGLESSGLRVVIEKVETPPAPAGRRMVKLELTGSTARASFATCRAALPSAASASRTCTPRSSDGGTSAEHLFKVKALLVVPEVAAERRAAARARRARQRDDGRHRARRARERLATPQSVTPCARSTMRCVCAAADSGRTQRRRTRRGARRESQYASATKSGACRISSAADTASATACATRRPSAAWSSVLRSSAFERCAMAVEMRVRPSHGRNVGEQCRRPQPGSRVQRARRRGRRCCPTLPRSN